MAATTISVFLILSTLACWQAAGTKIEGTTTQEGTTPMLSWYTATGQTDNCTDVPESVVPGALDDSICEEAVLNKKRSKKTARKYAERQKTGEVDKALVDQFQTGRVLAAISSRPGQCGRSDGYILEGKELEFYLRKIKSKKGK